MKFLAFKPFDDGNFDFNGWVDSYKDLRVSESSSKFYRVMFFTYWEIVR